MRQLKSYSKKDSGILLSTGCIIQFFYAVNALLVLNGFDIKTHSSVKSHFSQHFVKTGDFDKKFGKLLNQLNDWRQKGDYENLFDFTESDVAPLLASSLEMIEEINVKIKNAP